MNIVGILLAIFAFGLLVFVHELGHFIAARRAGVKINEFAIGMGPVIFKIIKGETQYSLRLFPVGGFLAMEGELEESSDGRAFSQASIPRRAVIMSAGAFMNILLCFLLITGVTFFQIAGKDVLVKTNQVKSFYPEAVTSQWLQENDTIIEVNGKKVKTFNDLSFQLLRDEDSILDVKVDRGGEIVELAGVMFDTKEIEGMKFTTVDFDLVGEKPTFFGTIKLSFDTTKFMSKQIWSGLYDLVRGKVGFNQLSGPVGITKQVSEQVKTRDWVTTIMFVAMLSLNLGIFNLLPFPALDGGRLLFLAIEALRKKPVSEKVEVGVNLAGMVILFGIIIIVTFKDVIGLFK